MKVAVLRGDQHRRGTILRARVDSSASLAQQRGASQRAGARGGVERRRPRVVAGHGLLSIGTRLEQERGARRLVGEAGDEEGRAAMRVDRAVVRVRFEQGLGNLDVAASAAHVQRRLEIGAAAHVQAGAPRNQQQRAGVVLIDYRQDERRRVVRLRDTSSRLQEQLVEAVGVALCASVSQLKVPPPVANPVNLGQLGGARVALRQVE
mmetsp:Transcript_32020/g.102769  ORF Transcript_32020/g.102769 Transcript_32020/m.102769 type:complete len:207 (-) Transcript_32020:94-714(-)